MTELQHTCKFESSSPYQSCVVDQRIRRNANVVQSHDFAFNISDSHINTLYSSPETHKSVIVNRQRGGGESMCVVILGVGVAGVDPGKFFFVQKLPFMSVLAIL